MKRHLVLFFLLGSAAVWAAGPAVQIKEASVYDKPSATAAFLGKLPYGTALKVLEDKNGWARVTAATGLTGWMRSQAFTTKPLNLKTGSDSSGTSSNEVSLAGRGFTEEVEQDYRAKNPTLDFAEVDKMEALNFADDALVGFLAAGGLKADGDRP